MLFFKQLNLHKSSQATILAGRDMAGQSKQILLATEPHTSHARVTGMPGGAVLVYDKSIKTGQPAPRACIVASRDVNLTAMDGWCSRDCAVALTKVRGKQVIIVSLYMDIKLPVISNKLQGLMKMIDDKGFPLIIGVDSNAHSSLYGPSNNARGDDFEDFILQHGLSVENIGNKPTFETRRANTMARTHIDVTLSRDLDSEIKHWRVCDQYNASDHNSIYFQVEAPQDHLQLIRPWSKANWEDFTNKLAVADYRVPADISMKKLDRLVDRLYTLISAALDSACPKIEVNPSLKDAHWANDTHTKACLLYTSPSPRDRQKSRMPSSA